MDFWLHGVGASSPHIVQGSTVFQEVGEIRLPEEEIDRQREEFYRKSLNGLYNLETGKKE